MINDFPQISQAKAILSRTVVVMRLTMLIKTPNYENIMMESENILLKKRGLLSIFTLQILVSDLLKMSIIDA